MFLEKFRSGMQFIIVVTVVLVLSIAYIFGAYNFYMDMKSDPVYENQIIASGVISDKYDESYSCGSKGRYTCFNRYLVVNGKAVPVSDNLYTEKRLGEHISLSQSTLVDVGYVVKPIGGVCIVVFWVMSLAAVIMFLMWVFSEEKKEGGK